MCMSECAACKVYRCREGGENVPKFCPMETDGDILQQALSCYQGEELKIAKTAAVVEAAGYGQWPRVREIMEFAQRMDYKKIGLAFCIGLREEARMFARILESNDFEVLSAACKTGSVPKEEIGLRPEEKLRSEHFEAMCNPIAQASLLDSAGSQLNVILGLCVGHDTLFIKHSVTPVTVLAAKDRVLAHNPLGALYTGHYYNRKLENIIQAVEKGA
jgi:uncharacterized metal-binding protein